MAAACAPQGKGPPRACPLDSPSATWFVKSPRSVPDWGLIASDTFALLLVGGLTAGNIACFGTNVCSDGSKVAVGITDGVLIAAALLALFALAKLGNSHWT